MKLPLLSLFALLLSGAAHGNLAYCKMAMGILTGREPVPGQLEPTFIKDRSVTHRRNDRALTALYLFRQAKEMGYEAEIQEWTTRDRKGHPVVLRNVIARKPGYDPSLAEEKVVVGAHYDTQNSHGMWRGSRAGAYQVSPGADDNGSGVVGVLGLMKKLERTALQRSVEFVFFDAEEPGRLVGGGEGGNHYVQSLGDDHGKVRLALVLDMIGATPRGQDNAYHLSLYRFPKEGVRRFLESHPTSGDIPFFIQGWGDPEFHGFFTDSKPFIQAEIPTMMFSNTATLKDLPRTYHTERDTPEIIDWGRFPRLLDQFEAIVKKRAGP